MIVDVAKCSADGLVHHFDAHVIVIILAFEGFDVIVVPILEPFLDFNALIISVGQPSDY